MEEDFEYVEINEKFWNNNWTVDYLENLDTSQYPFPNTLWHVKPAKEVTIKTTIMLLVGITGIFLNIIILLVLLRNKWLWSASNCLVGNLAFMDLMTLLFCPWFMLVRDFYQNYVLKNFGCHFEGFMQASLLLSSVLAVVVVSYDRLAAAALAADARVTYKAAPRLVVASWIVALALSLPWALNREYVERQWSNHLETYCAEDVQVLGVYWNFLATLLVWIPLGLMLVTYSIIMWRLECSARRLSSRGGGKSVIKARSRAMRITACVLITAVICRVPYTVLIYWRRNLKFTINGVEGSFEIMWFAANYLMYLNCAINPLIYGFTNARFRKAMGRTPGIACFKFDSWCCVCVSFKRKQIQLADKNTEKIFVIEDSPKPDKRFSRAIKNILHINKDSAEFSVRLDECTTKPTKVTPIKSDVV